MTDPARLIDSDEVGADLLASARADAPSPGARARTAAALGIGVGVAAMTAGGTAAASAGAGAGVATAAKVGGAGLVTKIIAGTIIVAAVGGGTAVAVRESSRPAAPVAVAAAKTTPAPIVPAPRAPAIVEEPAPTPVVEANALPSVPTSTIAPKIGGAAPAPQKKENDGALAREVRSLASAKALLEQNDAQGTLVALERHDREFSNGALAAEASMLRIEALLANGDDANAKRRAKELFAKDPNGPHAKRLQTILDR